ncbi:MAG: DEAD/DEAH box helicase, partial [Defluviitaleaceae bacterium]|nr:DEAD/DEAH box helicase [Defluviitaleaceae bacterium]
MDITDLKGVGAKRAHALQSAGIFSVDDLLEHFPRDYDDRSKIKKISELIPEAVNTIRVIVASAPENLLRKKFSLTKVIVKSPRENRADADTLEIIFFNQPYLKKYFKPGVEYIFTGTVRENAGGRMQIVSPDYEPAGETELSGGRIVPIYTPPKGFSQKTFRALIFRALEAKKIAPAQQNEFCVCENITQNENLVDSHALETRNNFPDALPEKIREKYNLCKREFAVRNIHFPANDGDFLAARRRLVFEELFFIQAALHEMKNNVRAQPGIVFEDCDCGIFLSALPFAFTSAQACAFEDISRDVQSGKRLNRLIQGDVGSGKTAVAFGAIFLAAQNGFQSAMMAPTDVLAAQHFTQSEKRFSPLGFETVLLTSSLGAKKKRETLEKISNGAAKIIIGTHALIQEKVNYYNL